MTETTVAGVTLRSLDSWPGYWAGEDGHIYSCKKGVFRRLKPMPNKSKGYAAVTLYRDDIRYWREKSDGRRTYTRRPTPTYVHHLIASVWLDAKPSPVHEIDHINEQKMDCRPTNLRWLTTLENGAAYRANNPDYFVPVGYRFSHPGELNPTAKLTDEGVRVIRRLQGRMTSETAGRVAGTSAGNVRRIWRREAWAHVPEDSAA